MKNYIRDWKFLVCLFSFFIGFFVAFHISIPTYLYLKHPERYTHFNHGISFNFLVFFKILTKNVFVSFLLYFVSFVGFGLLSPAILLLNGMYLGEMINFQGVSFKNIYVYFVFHGPLEIISFAIFGSLGLKGIKFYRDFFKEGWSVARTNIPKLRELIFPSLLLLFAALIESFLIVNY